MMPWNSMLEVTGKEVDVLEKHIRSNTDKNQ